MSRAANTLLFLAMLAAGVAFAGFGLGERLDLKLLDVQFRLLRAWFPQPVAREVVVVGIDEDTARRFPEPITLWHAHLSRFLGAMAQVRPAVVGIDIVLPDRSYETVLPGSDKLLMKGLLEARRAFPLVIALTVDPSGKPRTVHPPFLTLAGPGGAGYALFPVDRDGVVRRFDERLGESGELVPTLPGQLARHLKIEPRAGLIDFWRGAPFEYLPLHRVLEWYAANDQQALERAFRGKPVLLGAVLPFTDRQLAPVPLAAGEPGALDTPGVLLHAQALRNMLGPGFVNSIDSWLVALLAAAAALLWFVTGRAAMLVPLYFMITTALFAASTWFLARGWFLPVSAIALTGLLGLAGRNGYEAILQLRERRRLRASFGGYVSPAVMEQILAGKLKPELGGETRFVCVFFSDIRGYTTRSEQMTPDGVIRFLNRYFERVVALIHARGGTVVSFMGDGIMAVFGAPNPTRNPCAEAFSAATDLLEFLRELNARLPAEGVEPIEVGVGLHAGEAVVGHVGSSTRHDYTVIGDVANVASRLESLTKEAGFRMVVSKAVAEQLGGRAGLTSLGPMAIKGHTPVEVYGYDKI